MRLLYGRESNHDESLFEFILKTDNKDHAEFIRQIWIEFELWKIENKNILETVSLLFFKDHFINTDLFSAKCTREASY